MTRQEKAQRLAETQECVSENVSASAIMAYVPALQVHKCFVAVFRYGNRGPLSRLIATVKANREADIKPNQRKPVTATLGKPWKAAPKPQLALKFSGSGGIAHMLMAAAGMR